MTDVVVIGAGLAGLVAGWQAAEAGASVRVLAAGWGALYWHAGCIDVLSPHPTAAPGAAVAELISCRPDHPYAKVGPEGLASSLSALAELCSAAGYPLSGSLEANHLLPSGVGAARPTCLAPQTMTAGDLSSSRPMLIIGLSGHRDLHPELVAANLERAGVPARGAWAEVPELVGRRFVDAMHLARRFDNPAFRAEVVRAVAPHRGAADRIGFPAVLGLDRSTEAVAHLGEALGAEVFEIPTLPPSIPGIRLQRLLGGAIKRAGGRLQEGARVAGAEVVDGALRAAWSEAAARRLRTPAQAFILATGGILGGGISAEPDGTLQETALGLPISGPSDRRAWFQSEGEAGHPLYRAGVVAGPDLRPLAPSGEPLYPNLYAAGGILGGAEPIHERSLEGIALATGFAAGRSAALVAREPASR